MYFRFGSALGLVVLISLAAVALEKQNLNLRRVIIRGRYRLDVLQDAHARVRLETVQLASPARTAESLDARTPDGETAREPVSSPRQRVPIPRPKGSTPR